MQTERFENILQEAEKLPPAERLLLIERLIHDMRANELRQPEAPSWEDLAGSAPYPLCGEDAQEWASRERRAAEREQRET